MREKAEEINLVLLEPDVDLWRLRELALTEGGLVNGKKAVLVCSVYIYIYIFVVELIGAVQCSAMTVCGT